MPTHLNTQEGITWALRRERWCVFPVPHFWQVSPGL